MALTASRHTLACQSSVNGANPVRCPLWLELLRSRCAPRTFCGNSNILVLVRVGTYYCSLSMISTISCSLFLFFRDSKRDLQHKQDKKKIQKGSGKHNCTSSPPTKGVVCIYCICIIELVDSICRDSADTQYMLIQKNSQNLQNS